SASGMVSVTPVITIANNAATVVGWGAQMVVSSLPQVYTKTTANAVSASDGVVSNGTLLVASNNSTTALQVQNASGSTILGVDTSNGAVGINQAAVSGTALSVTGSIAATGTVRAANITASSGSTSNGFSKSYLVKNTVTVTANDVVTLVND